jgi:hypothetical protein
MRRVWLGIAIFLMIAVSAQGRAISDDSPYKMSSSPLWDLPNQKKACDKKGLFILNQCFYSGEWGGRLIAESGKINRDLTLLLMKEEADNLPFMILGGEFKGVSRWPKLYNTPLYLFDELSLEVRNFRVTTLFNLSEDMFFEVNYQFDNPLVLDAFLTIGNFKKSPFYWTVGQIYLPFGDFTKFDVEVNPLNKTIFRINQMGSTFGYYKGGHHFQLIAAPEKTRLGLAYSYTKPFLQGELKQGLSYLSNIVDGNKALRSLRPRKTTSVGALDYYAFYTLLPFQFHFELTSSLKPIEDVNPLVAYNIEGLYRFMLFERPAKFILSTSGLRDANKLNLNPHFSALGIFTRQYVASLKRVMLPHVTIGLAGIYGKKRVYEKQIALNLIVKV